jgi:hypothetical protein
MSERLNGGPFTLGYGQQCYIEYWWGNGDDRHLAYASAHPVGEFPTASIVSFDQRALMEGSMFEGGGYKYGVTIRNDSTDGDNHTPFDVYATTP